MGWSRQVFDKLPPTELYIFEAPLPASLEEDRRFLGKYLETETKYTFRMAAMDPTQKTAGGETRVADPSNFPVATGIAGAMVTIKLGGLREMHWHPNVSEWQYWIALLRKCFVPRFNSSRSHWSSVESFISDSCSGRWLGAPSGNPILRSPLR
jgi:hypothetical protein